MDTGQAEADYTYRWVNGQPFTDIHTVIDGEHRASRCHGHMTLGEVQHFAGTTKERIKRVEQHSFGGYTK